MLLQGTFAGFLQGFYRLVSMKQIYTDIAVLKKCDNSQLFISDRCSQALPVVLPNTIFE